LQGSAIQFIKLTVNSSKHCFNRQRSSKQIYTLQVYTICW